MKFRQEILKASEEACPFVRERKVMACFDSWVEDWHSQMEISRHITDFIVDSENFHKNLDNSRANELARAVLKEMHITVKEGADGTAYRYSLNIIRKNKKT